MPWGNRTGPMGYGPMTGRAAGYCAGYQVPGYVSPVAGRGFWGGAYSAGVPVTAYPPGYASYGPARYYGGFRRPFGFGQGFRRGFNRGWFGRGRGC